MPHGKNVLLATDTGTIQFLSDTYEGSVHDTSIADTTPYPLPRGSDLLQDLGFQGCVLDGVHKCQRTDDRSLAPRFNDGVCPGRFGQPRQQFIDAIGRLRWRFQAVLGRFASFARPRRDDQGRCVLPY